VSCLATHLQSSPGHSATGKVSPITRLANPSRCDLLLDRDKQRDRARPNTNKTRRSRSVA
jgi:hypothetical protein